jgi:hypothetical protein
MALYLEKRGKVNTILTFSEYGSDTIKACLFVNAINFFVSIFVIY